MHERPSVPNYGKAKTGELIKAGMCLAIEPMITLGTWKTKTLKDDWTVVTADGSLAAHFEHTIAITPKVPRS
jgi:methionyl aminopeptidase